MATALAGVIAGALGSFGTTAVGGLVAQGLATVAVTAGTSLALQALTPSQTLKSKGARLQNAKTTSSAEGRDIPEVFGEFRVSGNIIWATRFKEVVTKTTQSVGGKGGSRGKQKVETTTYSYYCSFAVGLCMGEVDSLKAIYFDGNKIDLADVEYAFYKGTDTQNPDPTIESVEGVGNVSGYRGLCYIVFDNLLLQNYGNRVPQVSCLVSKKPDDTGKTLDAVVEELCLKAGLALEDIDTTDLSDIIVEGFFTEGLNEPRSSIEELSNTFFFDVSDINGLLTFRKRSTPTVTTVPISDFAVTRENVSGFEVTTEQEENLPNKVIYTYVDPAKDFSSAVVVSERIGSHSNSVASVGSLISLPEHKARNIANVILKESYLSREVVRFSLPIEDYLHINCGDYLEIEVLGETFQLKVTSKEISTELLFECVVSDKSIYKEQEIPTGVKPSVVDLTPTATSLYLMDLPILPFEGSTFRPKISAYQFPWFGGVTIFREDGSGGHELFTQTTFPATRGLLVQDLHKGPVGVWDRKNALVVRLENPLDNLSSLSDLSVLNGENAVAIFTPSGEWEVIQFAEATLNVDGTYTLTKLLRGQLGTEYYMGDPTPAGSVFVFLDPDRLGELPITQDQIGLQLDLRYGPFGFSIDEDFYTDASYTPKSTPFRPYSPVHLKASYDIGGATLSWVRRTRENGDTWEVNEVPLGEDVELYEVDIYNGDTVVRTLTTPTNSVLYASAQQVEDFGSIQSSLDWRVYQMSALYGRGTPAIG